MGGVRAKIGLTGQLDRRQPGNYFKPWPNNLISSTCIILVQLQAAGS